MASFSPRELIRSTPGVVWAVTAAWVLVLVVWSVLPPIFRAPDEPQHVDLVLDTRQLGPLEWMTPEGNDVDHVVERAEEVFAYLDPASVEASGAHAERRAAGLTAAEAPRREDRPTHAELFAGPGLLGERTNQMAQHPPLYYRLAGVALRAVPGWDDLGFDVLVGLLRLLGVAFLAPLPVLLAATATVLGGRRHVAVTASVMPFAIPQLAHIGSVVTNDSLLVLAAATLTLLCCRVLTGDASATTGRWIGATLLVALLTKGFALLLVPAVGLTYLAAWWQAGRDRGAGMQRARVRRAAAWALGIAAVSLWWYGENLLRFGSLQPSVLAPQPPQAQGSLADFVPIAWRIQTQTFWGRVGWAEVGVTATTATVASLVLVALVAAGAWRRRADLLAVLVLPGAAVVAATLVRSYATFGGDGTIRAVQGRYAFLSVAGLLLLAAWGLDRLLPSRAQRWAWAAPVAAGIALHLDVGLRALRYFWGPDGDGVALAGAIGSLTAWSPWPPPALAVLSIATGVALLVMLLALVGTAW